MPRKEHIDCDKSGGQSLKDQQKRLGITQKDLAILLDANQATVNRWISGKVKPSHRSCLKISNLSNIKKIEAKRKITEYKTNRTNGIPNNNP